MTCDIEETLSVVDYLREVIHEEIGEAGEDTCPSCVLFHLISFLMADMIKINDMDGLDRAEFFEEVQDISEDLAENAAKDQPLQH